MGEDREGHPVWYDNFNYDFRGSFIPYIYILVYLCTYISSSIILLMYLHRATLFSEVG